MNISKVCNACGREREKRSDIKIDPKTFKSYCASSVGCVRQLRPTGLIDTEKELLEAALHRALPEKVKTVMTERLVKRAVAFRPNLTQAVYLMQLAEKYETNSINQLIRVALDRLMQAEPIEELPTTTKIGTDTKRANHWVAAKEEMKILKQREKERERREQLEKEALEKFEREREEALAAQKFDPPPPPEPEPEPEKKPEKKPEPSNNIFTL